MRSEALSYSAMLFLAAMAFLFVLAFLAAPRSVPPPVPVQVDPPDRQCLPDPAKNTAWIEPLKFSSFGIVASEATTVQALLTQHAYTRALADTAHFTAWMVLRMCKPLEIVFCARDPRGPTFYATCRSEDGRLCATGIFRPMEDGRLLGITAYVRPCSELDRKLQSYGCEMSNIQIQLP